MDTGGAEEEEEEEGGGEGKEEVGGASGEKAGGCGGKGRPKIAGLYRPPTHEELQQLKETENLFNSNLMKLQVCVCLCVHVCVCVCMCVCPCVCVDVHTMPFSCLDNRASIRGAPTAEGQSRTTAGAAAALSQVHPDSPPSH